MSDTGYMPMVISMKVRVPEWLMFDGLQDAYERAVVAEGSFVKVVFYTSVDAPCLLVNRATVGGLRDDEREATTIRAVI